jgi:radical SAM superfamily enzyme YgiQ (UPF0313 family)
MKILVLNPPTCLSKNVVRDVLYGCWCGGKRIGGATVPPFALLQVATVLKNDNNDIDFLDAQAEQISLGRLKQRVFKTEIAMVLTSTMTFEEDAKTLQYLKEINPGILTIVFGSHPTFLPQATLAKPGIDIAVRHESEYVLRDIVRCFRQGLDWKQVRGIAYKDNNRFFINPAYPFIENLDELPFPDVSLLPKNIDYFSPIVRRMPYIATATSRGCSGRCVFCTAPSFEGNRLRFQSAAYVVEEIKYFLQKGFKEIYFRDETFFVDKERDKRICQEIIDKKLDVTWIANARVGMLDKETMRIAKEAGCHTIKFGIESGDQAVLDKSEKGYKIQHAYDTFTWARKIGIATHAHCMLGMPGDNEGTIKKTIKFAKELRATTATFGICTPYPGAPLYYKVLSKHPEVQDGSSLDLSKVHIRGFFNEAFADIEKDKLERYVIKAYRSFYMRPKIFWEFIKQIRTVEDIKRITLAGARVLDFAVFGQ